MLRLFRRPAYVVRVVYTVSPSLVLSPVIPTGIGIGETEAATGLGEETTTGTGGETGAGAGAETGESAAS